MNEYFSRDKRTCHKFLKNSVKIRKILNGCNFEDNDFLSTSQRSLEARNFDL